MGTRKYRQNTSKERAESVPIQKALGLIQKLNLTQKEYAENFCCVNADRFSIWKRRGLMPAHRYWASQNALREYFFKEYQQKMEMINGD